LQVERAKYETPECRNVALGHVLKSLDLFFERIPDSQPVLDFARRQLRNRRDAVRLRARAFLQKHERIARPKDPAHESQPIRSPTNRTAAAAGARR
jgi:hypothetical protein